MSGMFAFVPAALFLTLFGVSVRADRRRFRNAVYLGLTFIFTSVGLLSQVTRLPSGVAQAVVLAVFLVPTVGTLALGVFLIGNGLTMVRKEGRRPGNLLSFAAGVAIFLLIAFVLVTADTGPPALDAVVAGVVFLVAYVSFLFLCFLAYAYLYGRIKVRGDVDYVVMLGSGLIGGDRVPPLLASRLRKGQAIHDAQIARGGRAPLLLTSGGRGTDEKVAEARAMADWLMTEGGVPREHLRLEDRSRTTEENLRFSRTVMETEILLPLRGGHQQLPRLPRRDDGPQGRGQRAGARLADGEVLLAERDDPRVRGGVLGAQDRQPQHLRGHRRPDGGAGTVGLRAGATPRCVLGDTAGGWGPGGHSRR